MVEIASQHAASATKQTPHVFASWLPLIGLLIGALFLGGLFLAGRIAPTTAPTLPLEVVRLEAGTKACARTDGVPLTEGRLRIGVSKPPYELLVRTPPGGETRVLYFPKIVDAAVLYLCSPSGAQEMGRDGDLIRPANRFYPYEKVAFPVEPDSTYHLQITQSAAISQQVLLTTDEGFRNRSTREFRIRLALYGAMAMIITYNIILAFVAATPGFFFNAAVSASMVVLDIYQMGFGVTYIWGAVPQISNHVLIFGLAGPTLFGPFFMASFFGDGTSKSFAEPRFWGWSALSVGLMILGWITLSQAFMIALVSLWIVMTLFFTLLLVRALRRGDDRARILLVPLFGAVIPAMVAGSMDSWGEVNFGILQNHLTELALVLEALTFTLALAYMIRIARWREAEALKALNAHAASARAALLSAIDRDRTRIAGELHDSAGQALILAGAGLKRLQAELPEPALSNLANVQGIIGETLSGLRSLSHDLHPATLDHLGLEGAIAAMVDTMAQTTGREIEAQIDPDMADLGAETGLQVYRIVQELLNNAAKHSGEGAVELNILRNGAGLRISAENPVGAGRPKGASLRGIGSAILAERVERLGGTISTDLDDGWFRVLVDVPDLGGGI